MNVNHPTTSHSSSYDLGCDTV